MEPIKLICPVFKSDIPLNGSNIRPSISEYIALIVKSLLAASIFQSGVNSTSACLPSVETSFLKVVI